MFGLVPFNRRNGLASRRDFFSIDNFFDSFFNDSFAGFFTAVNPIRADIRETEKEYIIRRERRYGSYCRSFRVDGVREDKVTAKYENGVLTVKLPKSEESRPKSHRIDIN